jgi:hypothetical protein
MGKRRLAFGLFVLLFVTGASLTACSGSSSAPTTTATPATSSTSTTTIAAPTASSPSTTGVTPSTSTAVLCRTSQLRIQPGSEGGAAGNAGLTVVFTNVSRTTCTMNGYPGVAALDAQGSQVVQAERRETGMMGGLANDTSSVPFVTLAPGQAASAEIEGSDVPLGTALTCVDYPSFLITPPGEIHAVRMAAAMVNSTGYGGFPGCRPISVNPVVPGATGRAQ